MAHHAEHGMGPGALLVHAGLSDMAGLVAFFQNANDVLSAGHNVLPQAGHKHAILLVLMDLQLCACAWGQQVMHLLVVELQVKAAVVIISL